MATWQLRNLEEVTLISSSLVWEDTRTRVNVLRSMPGPGKRCQLPKCRPSCTFYSSLCPSSGRFFSGKNVSDAAAADQHPLPEEQHGCPGREEGPITSSPRRRARCGSVSPPLPLPTCEARDATRAQATCTRRMVYYWSLAREQADRQSKKIC